MNPRLSEQVLQAPAESYGPETACPAEGQWGPETAWISPQPPVPPLARASGARAGGEAGWVRSRGPAPAGALQRTLAGTIAEESATAEEEIARGRKRRAKLEEEEYVPRRGASRWSALRPSRVLRAMMRSWAGRGVLAFLLLVLLGAAAVGLAQARSALLRDARFELRSASAVEVSGVRHLTRSEVLAVFGGDLERSVLRVDLPEREADLERLPWVEHATVMRLLPDRLRVQIRERTPVAFVRQGTQIGLVDAQGVLLDMPATDAGDPSYSFPVLTGITAADPLSTRAARVGIYREFLKALDSGSERLSRNVSEVDVSDPEDVRAVVADGGSDVLVHFGERAFLERYRQFEAHLPAWRAQYPKLAAADMRYDGQIVLEMAHADAAPTPGAGVEAPGTSAPEAKAVASEPVKAAAKLAAVSQPAAKAPAAKVPAAKLAAKAPAVKVPAAKVAVVPAKLPAKVPAAKLAAVPAAVPAVKVPTAKVAAKAAKKPAALKVAAGGRAVKGGAVGKAKPRATDGRSKSNERLFAELAAARKQSVAAKATGGVGSR